MINEVDDKKFMIINRIFFLVALPLLIGFSFYYFDGTSSIYIFCRNYLPDGLWAFAFMNAILLIWRGRVNYIWVIMVVLSYIVFEAFQQLNFIQGTADLWDILIYTIFSLISLLYNSLNQQQLHEKIS